jgi:hypothetical protein
MTDDDICGSTNTSSGEPCGFTPGESCPYHDTDDPPDMGRPSKFDDARDDLLAAADSFLNHKQVANKGGVSRSTLYDYLDKHDDISDRFKRARADAAERLVQRALDPRDEIDIQFARFLLERSFKFIKTEKREITSGGGGPLVVIDDGDD